MPDPRPSFTAFRLWADYWREETVPSSTHPSLQLVRRSENRRTVWRLYYDFLSAILYSGNYYSTRPLSDPTSNGTLLPHNIHHSSHYTELRRVEQAYERVLLNEVSFPEANEVNHEVDDWANQVMSNWNILCGPDWQDDELGEGGKELAGRNVLGVSRFSELRHYLN